ncbi:hypothetical protein RhiirA4_514772 [Rhizophagus irregularis]|uniref:Uncharacterized protein n=1 Tax=Rhizophagus irregularis TaxID=588596 RepID=A0A2I1GDU4_9GLOM|nr:hypothetical protein RhiirA4_514772 [Rhizophagus irregularis]
MEYGTDNYSCPTTQKQHELSVEGVYDKEELSTKLVVKDHNADMYRVFHSRKEFWEFHDNVTEHLRSFSEVVYGDLPQFPRIHVEFGSLNRISGTKIVNLLRQVLDGMLEVFRDNYSGITNVPKSPNGFVVMDEYGQNRHGYLTNDFHIQATSFTFTDYKEAKEFTHRVRSSLPIEYGEESLQNKDNRDKQSGSTGDEQKEGTITTLPTKKHLPSINNQYAVTLNCLVLLSFIANEIKQSNKRQMRSGTRVTESKIPQKKKDGMLERQQHQRQHRGNARIGKDLGRRSNNRWIRWKARSNQNIRFKNYFRKNETNNWERILVSMIALVRNVIFTHNISETRSYGCGPHMFIAITPLCHSYQFNPP